MIYIAATSKNKLYHIDPMTIKKAFETGLFCEGAHTIKIDHNRQYIYMADSYERSISIVDMIKNEKQSVGVGTSPCHMAICKKNDMIYVANYDSDSISVIEAKSLTNILTIKTGSMPHHICLSHDDAYLYVLLMGSNQLLAIDTDKNKSCGQLDLDATPMHMRIGKLTGQIYVACTDFEKSTDGKIIVIDAKNPMLTGMGKETALVKKPYLKKYPLGKYLSDLYVLEDEMMLYAIDGQENMLYAMDLSTAEVLGEIKTGEFPSTIEYDQESDRIFVGTHIENVIEGYDRKSLKLIDTCKVQSDFGHMEV